MAGPNYQTVDKIVNVIDSQNVEALEKAMKIMEKQMRRLSTEELPPKYEVQGMVTGPTNDEAAVLIEKRMRRLSTEELEAGRPTFKKSEVQDENNSPFDEDEEEFNGFPDADPPGVSGYSGYDAKDGEKREEEPDDSDGQQKKYGGSQKEASRQGYTDAGAGDAHEASSTPEDHQPGSSNTPTDGSDGGSEDKNENKNKNADDDDDDDDSSDSDSDGSDSDDPSDSEFSAPEDDPLIDLKIWNKLSGDKGHHNKRYKRLGDHTQLRRDLYIAAIRALSKMEPEECIPAGHVPTNLPAEPEDYSTVLLFNIMSGIFYTRFARGAGLWDAENADPALDLDDDDEDPDWETDEEEDAANDDDDDDDDGEDDGGDKSTHLVSAEELPDLHSNVQEDLDEDAIGTREDGSYDEDEEDSWDRGVHQEGPRKEGPWGDYSYEANSRKKGSETHYGDHQKASGNPDKASGEEPEHVSAAFPTPPSTSRKIARPKLLRKTSSNTLTPPATFRKDTSRKPLNETSSNISARPSSPSSFKTPAHSVVQRHVAESPGEKRKRHHNDTQSSSERHGKPVLKKQKPQTERVEVEEDVGNKKKYPKECD